MTKSLFEETTNYDKKCRLCGKVINHHVYGYSTTKHGRMHVRRGEAKEIHVQSSRCYAGYDVDFVIMED